MSIRGSGVDKLQVEGEGIILYSFSMSRKRLLVLMVILLMVILAMGGYLWFFRSEVFKGQKTDTVEEINIEKIVEEAKKESYNPSKSITKMVAVDKKEEGGVEIGSDVGEYESVKSRYFIRGILLDDMEVVNGFLYGSFYIKGDELKREIILTAGTGEGKIYFGYVEDKEDGNYESSWKMVDSEFASILLMQGEEIYIEVLYDALGEPEEYNQQTRVLEAISEDIELGKNEYVLPISFGIYTLKLGVVE